jgi:hypothetical protein
MSHQEQFRDAFSVGGRCVFEDFALQFQRKIGASWGHSGRIGSANSICNTYDLVADLDDGSTTDVEKGKMR